MLKTHVLFSILLALVSIATIAFGAPTPDKNGWINTGSGVRTKSVAFVSVKVYAIRHDMKEAPSEKSKRAVIDADVEKKFTWKMLRDVDAEKIQNALKDAYSMNGFGDGARIGQFIGALNKELKEGTYVTISYNATAKQTTVSVSSGGSATVAGVDFMKATWSIWFGKIDQPALSDALISNL